MTNISNCLSTQLEKNNCGLLRSPMMPLYHSELSSWALTNQPQRQKHNWTMVQDCLTATWKIALVLGQHFYWTVLKESEANVTIWQTTVKKGRCVHVCVYSHIWSGYFMPLPESLPFPTTPVTHFLDCLPNPQTWRLRPTVCVLAPVRYSLHRK